MKRGCDESYSLFLHNQQNHAKILLIHEAKGKLE